MRRPNTSTMRDWSRTSSISSVVKAGFAPVAAYSSTKARACSRVIMVMTVRPANARARNNAPALREGGEAVAVSFTLSLSPHGGAGWLGSRSEAQAPARVSVHRSRSADPPCAEHVSRPTGGHSRDSRQRHDRGQGRRHHAVDGEGHHPDPVRGDRIEPIEN